MNGTFTKYTITWKAGYNGSGSVWKLGHLLFISLDIADSIVNNATTIATINGSFNDLRVPCCMYNGNWESWSGMIQLYNGTIAYYGKQCTYMHCGAVKII